MKKLYTLSLILFLITINSHAQWIVSFSVIPPNPISTDTVRVIIENQFPSGDCEGVGILNGVNGNEITAGGLHCIGMLSVICTDYDTIVIPPLPGGQYSFIFLLQTGQGNPCVPGILPLVIDSVHFTVLNWMSVEETSNNHFQISPNPSDGRFKISETKTQNCMMKIFTTDGRLINSIQLNHGETEMNFDLPPGIYTAIIEGKEKRLVSKLIITK